MNAAFFVVFALFVVAMIVLGVLSVRWGVRRDRAALAERERADGGPGGDGGSGGDGAAAT